MLTFEFMEDFEIVNQLVDLLTAITSRKDCSCIPASGADSLDIGGVADITSKLDLQEMQPSAFSSDLGSEKSH